MKSSWLIKATAILAASVVGMVMAFMAASTAVLIMLPYSNDATMGAVVGIGMSAVLVITTLTTLVIYEDVERRLVLKIFMRQLRGKTVTFKQSFNVSD